MCIVHVPDRHDQEDAIAGSVHRRRELPHNMLPAIRT
jgi:hypothetical protein